MPGLGVTPLCLLEAPIYPSRVPLQSSEKITNASDCACCVGLHVYMPVHAHQRLKWPRHLPKKITDIEHTRWYEKYITSTYIVSTLLSHVHEYVCPSRYLLCWSLSTTNTHTSNVLQAASKVDVMPTEQFVDVHRAHNSQHVHDPSRSVCVVSCVKPHSMTNIFLCLTSFVCLSYKRRCAHICMKTYMHKGRKCWQNADQRLLQTSQAQCARLKFTITNHYNIYLPTTLNPNFHLIS